MLDWQREDPKANEVEVFWKEYGDGVHVEVRVERNGDQFFVHSISESRYAGPSESMSEGFEDFEKAAETAAQKRNDWDLRLEGE